jgi:endonuclease/exonuclease/phosphatase family metal-dependent hydrolase
VVVSFSPVVVTYNVRLGLDGGLAAVGDALATLEPDIVCLQEIGVRWQMGECVDQPAALAARLGFAHVAFAGALTDARGGRFGVAVLSRRGLRSVSVALLPRAADEQRVLLQVALDTHPPIHVFNTHLSIHEPERMLQAARVAEAVGQVEGPTLLLGDFNDLPESAVLETLRRAAPVGAPPLWDLFDETGEGDPLTFSVKAPNRRIDYLLCGGGFLPEGCRVLTGVRTSDHFPLVGAVSLAAHPPVA